MADQRARWDRVSERLAEWSKHPKLFKYGQENSLLWISKRIRENGVIIADEVGLGKTRLALLVMIAVLEEGENVAAVVPPGLLYQWSQEAEEVMAALQSIENSQIQSWKPITIRTYQNLFDFLGEKETYPLADSKQNRWILISQTFDLYKVRSSASAWRIHLPAFVKAHRALQTINYSRNTKKYRQDKWIRYWRNECAEDIDFKEDHWYFNENKAAEYLSRFTYRNGYEKIFKDERLRPNRGGISKANVRCSEFFQANNDGRTLLMHLVGKLIGPIDLLVVDEAHKSRDYGETPSKRLGKLLTDILITTRDHRRICMTATPIELDPAQWKDLLDRTGINDRHPAREKIDGVIDEFAYMLKRSRECPDQLEVLDRLMRSAKIFEKALSPFVTRRRRINQEEMRHLLPPEPTGAHPHRHLKPFNIEVTGLSDSWRKMVLALEGQGRSSKGIGTLDLDQRQADIRYSSALPCEFSVDLDDKSSIQKLTRKEQRFRSWARTQQWLSKTMSGGEDSWLWNHPRIVYAADRIEELCAFEGLYPCEKVLVFGKFTDPMKALQDTLNLRHTLRILDSGNVAMVPFVKSQGKHLYKIYQDLLQHHKFSGFLNGNVITKEALLIEVDKARDKYEKMRNKLQKRFPTGAKAWILEQPGDAALLKLKREDYKTFEKLFELLRADIFDALLYHADPLKKTTREKIYQLAHEAWLRHLRCILHDADEPNDLEENNEDNAVQRTEYKGERKDLISLDQKADIISPERFKAYLSFEPRSHFSRILDGNVKTSTRRSIQASFNRHETGPYVLIAQSVVGREGLNLHKACRRVFLFHPEWNPAVMEQQIGRVDRIESFWNLKAEEWDRHRDLPYPLIEVESLVFHGTYDEYQAQILCNRRAMLNAQLFGALLDEETIEKVPLEYRKKLEEAAPDWEPKTRAKHSELTKI